VNEKMIICIVCPLGCEMKVSGDGKEVQMVTGQGCERGKTYAADEFLSPMRILTSSVKVTGAASPLVPVRSNGTVPQELLLECVEHLRHIELKAPVAMYDIIVPDILGTGVDIVATAGVTGG
jgi:CxxC motif-containing protein